MKDNMRKGKVMLTGDKTPNEERLERELAVQKRITQAAINSNAHWEDVSEFLVWDRPQDQYDEPISEQHMASALATYPQFAADIRDFVKHWNAVPRITDEILDAVEVKPEDIDRSTRRVAQILDFYRKLRKVEGERDALEREALLQDKERLDWLERMTDEGACPALIFDDNGHWAMAFDGTQNIPEGDGPQDISTMFFVDKENWRDSVREAIDAAIKEGS